MNQDMVKLSIGIPVYNQVTTIERTIKSVLSQTKQPFEIVISENHSTDGTDKIVKKYKDKVKIVKPERHLSMAENWNFCVSQCSGDWVGLISGDDILLKNYVKEMINGIVLDKQAIFVMAGWRVINKTQKTQIDRFILSMPKVSKSPHTTKKMLKGGIASFASFCFKKDVFNKIGGFDTNYNLIQDWILQFDLSFKGNFININKIVAEYLSDYNAKTEQQRISLYIEDFSKYLTEKIWIANEIGIKNKTIKKAGRIVLRNLFNRISHNNYKLDKEQIQKIEIICEKFNAEKLYKDLITNKLRKNSRISKMKNILRNIYSTIK